VKLCATQMQVVDGIRYIAFANPRHAKACPLETSKKNNPCGIAPRV